MIDDRTMIERMASAMNDARPLGDWPDKKKWQAAAREVMSKMTPITDTMLEAATRARDEGYNISEQFEAAFKAAISEEPK